MAMALQAGRTAADALERAAPNNQVTAPAALAAAAASQVQVNKPSLPALPPELGMLNIVDYVVANSEPRAGNVNSRALARDIDDTVDDEIHESVLNTISAFNAAMGQYRASLILGAGSSGLPPPPALMDVDDPADGAIQVPVCNKEGDTVDAGVALKDISIVNDGPISSTDPTAANYHPSFDPAKHLLLAGPMDSSMKKIDSSEVRRRRPALRSRPTLRAPPAVTARRQSSAVVAAGAASALPTAPVTGPDASLGRSGCCSRPSSRRCSCIPKARAAYGQWPSWWRPRRRPRRVRLHLRLQGCPS